ncbi:MAG: nucleoside-diphosphate sugar epimerase/dehydratase, partial [Syntrophobacteria bacterium]
PVGFIDDDVRKHKKKIQGYKVFGGRDRLEELLARHRISEIIFASSHIPPETMDLASSVCENMGVKVRNLELSLR